MRNLKIEVVEVAAGFDPFGVQKSTEQLDATIGKILYWINPVNWFVEVHRGLDWLINQPDTATGFLAATIVLIWLIQLGAEFPKKWLFWGWICYWFLRAVVYKH